MSRDWLPPSGDLAEDIAALQSTPEPASRWQKVRELAKRDHDFASIARLDRTLRRLRADADATPPADLMPVRLAVLSTSTAGHLAPSLRIAALGRNLLLDLYEPDYGQVAQELADPNAGIHQFKPQAVLFANDSYSLFGTRGEHALEDAESIAQRVQSVVEGLRRQWRRAREAWDCDVIQQLPVNPFPRSVGENEHLLPGSPWSMLDLFQARLRIAAKEDKVDLVDLQQWALRDGLKAWHSTALWHRSKQEVHPWMAPLYGDLVARVLAARRGKSAKCLVLDLDNTLWGGVIGDDGIAGIVLGNGSAVGEGHMAFQQYAKQLARRGVILAVCSKNDDAVARDAFKNHPEMVLKLEDISCFVANWTDKASNLRHIARELNIGIDALVFADDNPFERNLIRTELPQVFVPELSEDVADYARTIAESGCFEAVTLTQDDLAKTQQYQSNAQRQALLDDATDLDSYLAALDMTMVQRPFDEVGLVRITQLINKTNQFNLTTRRYTEAEVKKLLNDPDAVTRQIRLVDRFGDNGIIGIVIGRHDRAARSVVIETWLMSCRVLGRNVEQATLNVIAAAAARGGAETLIGDYLPTERNGMVKDHYATLGFTAASTSASDAHPGATRWSLPLADFAERPTHIKIEGDL